MKSFVHPNARDLTEHARAIGYNGNRKVMVLDGKVISHGQKDWFAFCAQCRTKMTPKPRTSSHHAS